MSSLFKTIAKIAPIALPFVAPGLGTALGAALGATGAGAGALGSGLIGAGLGAASGGGLKGALMGGATGGLGGYAQAGGFDNILGSAAGTTLDKASGVAGAQGPTMGSGITGAITREAPSLGGIVSSGGVSGGGSATASSGGRLMSALSGLQQMQAQDDLEEMLASQQAQYQDALSPYLSAGGQASQQLSDRLTSGFDSSNLYDDPSYQARLSQGSEALNRTLAAQGLGQSGAAIKASQQFGQDLASQEYDNAYNRWLQQNSQLSGVSGSGLGATNALGNIYTNQGNIMANASLGRSNALNNALSGVLSGSGAIVGYDENGNPIYR